MSSVRTVLILASVSSLIPAEFVVSVVNNTTEGNTLLEEIPSPVHYRIRGENSPRGASLGRVLAGDECTLRDTDAASDEGQSRIDAPAGGTRESHPFRFEYRSPHPSSFQKTPGNLPQIATNQNTAAKQSVGHIIKYISEKMYENGKLNVNPSRRVQFSGFYLNPRKSDGDQTQYRTDVSSRRCKFERDAPSREPVGRAYNGHAYNTDPLFLLKPTSPGDINLLAEHAFRFAPTFAQNRNHRFSAKGVGQKGCYGAACHPARPADPTDIGTAAQEDPRGSEAISHDTVVPGMPKNVKKDRPFSVMLDVYPINNRDEDVIAFPEHLKVPTAIQPSVKPKPKPAFYPLDNNSPSPYYHYYPAPGHFRPGRGSQGGSVSRLPIYPPNQSPQINQIRVSKIKNIPVQMLIHLNLYPKKKIYANDVHGERNDRMDSGAVFNTDSDYGDDLARNYFGKKDKNLSRLRKILSESFDSKILSNHSKNITVDEIRKGREFVLPGPKIYFLPLLNSTSRHL